MPKAKACIRACDDVVCDKGPKNSNEWGTPPPTHTSCFSTAGGQESSPAQVRPLGPTYSGQREILEAPMAFLLPPGAAPGSLLTPAICSWRDVGDLREVAATEKQDSLWACQGPSPELVVRLSTFLPYPGGRIQELHLGGGQRSPVLQQKRNWDVCVWGGGTHYRSWGLL